MGKGGPKTRFTRAQVEKVLELWKEGKPPRVIALEMRLYHNCPISIQTMYAWRAEGAPWLRERFGEELRKHWALKRELMGDIKTAAEDKKWELAAVIMDGLTRYISDDLLAEDEQPRIVTAQGAKELRRTLECIAKILPEQKLTGKFEQTITNRYHAIVDVITGALPQGLPGGPGIYPALRPGIPEDTRPGDGEPDPVSVQLDAAGVAGSDRPVPGGEEAGTVHHPEGPEVGVLDPDPD